MGENDKLWAYTTAERMGRRSATICLCFNPMIFWFLGLESLGPVKLLKQDNRRLRRFSLSFLCRLGSKPSRCLVSC